MSNFADFIDAVGLVYPATLNTLPLQSDGATINTVATLLQDSIPLGSNVLSGALTADTYKEVVSYSSPGMLQFCGAASTDATSRTIGIKIVINGTTVLDDVSGAIAATGTGWVAVGVGYYSSNGGMGLANIPFQTLSIQVKSSITETDKVLLKYVAWASA